MIEDNKINSTASAFLLDLSSNKKFPLLYLNVVLAATLSMTSSLKATIRFQDFISSLAENGND